MRAGTVSIDAAGNAASITAEGADRLSDMGLALRGTKRPTCRLCLDWSERRPHLAGALGAALLEHALEQDWVRRVEGGRELRLTEPGRKAFQAKLGVAFSD